MMSEAFFEFMDNVFFSGEGVLYTIDFTQPLRDTTASTAIADGIVVVATPDDGMDKSTVMAIAEDDLCIFFRNAVIVLRAFGDENITVHAKHDFRLNGIIAFLCNLTAGTGTNRQFRRHIHDLFSFFSLEQIRSLQLLPP
jgi:hypothetical protein